MAMQAQHLRPSSAIQARETCVICDCEADLLTRMMSHIVRVLDTYCHYLPFITIGPATNSACPGNINLLNW